MGSRAGKKIYHFHYHRPLLSPSPVRAGSVSHGSFRCSFALHANRIIRPMGGTLTQSQSRQQNSPRLILGTCKEVIVNPKRGCTGELGCVETVNRSVCPIRLISGRCPTNLFLGVFWLTFRVSKNWQEMGGFRGQEIYSARPPNNLRFWGPGGFCWSTEILISMRPISHLTRIHIT